MTGLKKLFFCLALTILTFPLFTQANDQNLDFFKNTQELEFAKKTSIYIYEKLKSEDFPYAKEAAVIVIPELLRYSTLQDKLEIFFNKILTMTSNETNGFSIGPLQMKPIFAINIEQLISKKTDLKEKYGFLLPDSQKSENRIKLDRLLKLKDLDSQIEYLKVFVETEIKRLNLSKQKSPTRILYLATSYNNGFNFTRTQLKARSTRYTFPLPSNPQILLNYSNLCLEFYQKFSSLYQ